MRNNLIKLSFFIKTKLFFSVIYSFIISFIILPLHLSINHKAFAQKKIECTSCQGEFCSSSTSIGVIFEQGIEKKNYNLSISFSCSECSGYTLRIFFDDGTRKTYLSEKQPTEGEQGTDINFSGFEISDGLVLIGFELSATGQQGYTVVDSFSCNIYFDDYPDKVEGVEAVGEDRRFIVRWNKHPDRDIRFFRVYYGYPSGCSDENIDVEGKYEIEITSVGGEEVKNGKTYCGFVQAIDNSGKISPPSEFFYVVPAKNIEFAKSGPPDENIGCIISYSFGSKSEITKFLRKIKSAIVKLPGGRFLVNTYYKISSFLLGIIRKIKDFFSYILLPRQIAFADSRPDVSTQNESFRETEEKNNSILNRNSSRKRNFATIGVSTSSFEKAGVISGTSTFSLAYGRRIWMLNFSYGRKIFSFLKDDFLQLYAYGDVSVSYIRGRRVIFGEGGGISSTPDFASSILILPFKLGILLFGEFVEEQIFVPFLGAGFSDFIFFESYTADTKSVFGNVFGFSADFGGMLLLDMFDRRSEAVARNEYGIKDTYLYFKGSYSITNFVRKKGSSLSLKKSNYFDFSSIIMSFGISIFM